MPIDLKKLTSRKISGKPIDPLEIWNQLDREVGKEYLRPIQEDVLKRWFKQRTQTDVIVKMNTGTGKTLVGLLTLQSSLHEGLGPAVYICPDNFLVGQALEQAKQFGVKCVSFGGAARDFPPEFQNGEAILVTNIKKVFNGKSVFGVEGDGTAPVPIGTLLLDDAHACVEQIRSQFTISLGNKHPAYQKILALFAGALKHQKPGTLAEIEAGDYAKFMAVPYWAWIDSHTAVIQILSEHRESDELIFTWPLLKNILPLCNCVISGGQLEIMARVTQPNMIPSFLSAKRKIYLSATLLDDSQMARDLGVASSHIASEIRPNEFDDLAERLILIPTDADTNLGTNFATALMKGSHKINRIVLIPTKKEAPRWEAVGVKPVLAANIEQALPPLRSSKGHFLALISKYDGIDLPDDMCRLLVLDSLPRAANLHDWYMQSMLTGTPTVNAKIAQRIEQGLGRATRGKSDYCVILLAGNDLVSFVRNKQNRLHFSPGTNTQIELGLEITSEVRRSVGDGKHGDALIQEINRCLRRDDEWKAVYRSFIDSARAAGEERKSHSPTVQVAETERAAAELFLKRDYVKAHAEVQKLVDRAGLSDREKGWYLQLAAAYLYPGDKSKAMSAQKKAHELNQFVFLPPEGIQYHRMSQLSESQAVLALRFILQFETTNDFVMHSSAVCDHLAFGVESESFEQALADVAHVLGISSSRPEKEVGRGPDVLWLADTGEFLVIEAKSEVLSDRKEIFKSETEQLIHSCEWFRQEYAGKTPRVLLIHPATDLAHNAVFPTEGRIATPETLEKFVQSVRSYVAAIAKKSRASLTHQSVGQELQAYQLRFSDCFTSAHKAKSTRK